MISEKDLIETLNISKLQLTKYESALKRMPKERITAKKGRNGTYSLFACSYENKKRHLRGIGVKNDPSHAISDKLRYKWCLEKSVRILRHNIPLLERIIKCEYRDFNIYDIENSMPEPLKRPLWSFSTQASNRDDITQNFKRRVLASSASNTVANTPSSNSTSDTASSSKAHAAVASRTSSLFTGSELPIEWRFLVEEFKASEHKPPYPEGLIYSTGNGFNVRSKSEAMIATFLNMCGFHYIYECPIELNGKIYFPDFVVLCPDERIVFWEHLGLVDNESYLSSNAEKFKCYIENGIVPSRNLIVSSETADNPLDMQKIKHCAELLIEC